MGAATSDLSSIWCSEDSNFWDGPISQRLISYGPKKEELLPIGIVGYGVGINFGRHAQDIIVVSFVPGGTAAKSGIQIGDSLHSIDGEILPTENPLERAKAKIVGPRGKKLSVQVRRVSAAVESLETFILRREVPVKA
ncbi:hypothetical protein T484DRAFT_1936941 [Baffinella frigidus]|nr:hypothetical protein T484DRAFT_1936941 [Cryptophyta sp. CCMP2293]|mmetsp:Transcript_61907/g.141722  ORF Transcript_61907/g.141722 Transcript_61907/m.141722 type:complete len:138 (-) Transcript_61907:194-607(-)